MRNKKWLGFILGIVISICLLYVVFKKVNFYDVLKYIYTAKVEYAVVSIIIGILMLILRSYRWRLLVKEYKSYKLSNFFESTITGLFFNTLLPFRLGDLIQGISLSQKTTLPKSLTVSSVFMERFVDLFPPVLILIIGSFFIILPKEVSLVLSSVVLLVLVLGMVFVLKFKDYILTKLRKIATRFNFFIKLTNVIEKFFSAISNFGNFKMLCKIILLTFLLWTGYSIGMYFICLSLGITLPSIWASYVVQAVTALSVAVPSSPGYVGSWEFMGTVALSIFKIEKTKAVSFAVFSHILGMLPIIVLGIIFVFKHISLMEYLKKEEY